MADVEMYNGTNSAPSADPKAVSLPKARGHVAHSGQIRDERSATREVKSARLIEGSALRARAAASVKEDAHREYGHFFRQLQIQPQKHERFFLWIVKVIRNKHLADLRRATDKSIQSLTRVLLRGFGKIVWGKTAGEWLIDRRELNPGERRLEYFINDATHDERFFNIMEEMWFTMRDVLFEEKPVPKPRRPALKSGAHSPEAAVVEQNLEKKANQKLEPAMPFQRAQDQALDRIALRARRAWDLPAAAGAQPFTPDQTDDAIVGLVVRLSEIRSKSDPDVFAIQWERHIMRLEEVEAAARSQQEHAQAAAVASGTPNTAAPNAGSKDDDEIKENVTRKRVHPPDDDDDDDPIPKRPRLAVDAPNASSGAAQKWRRHTNRPMFLTTTASTPTIPDPLHAAAAAAAANPPPLPRTEAPPANPSNEPFASHGHTIPQAWPKRIAPELPAVMSLYISVSSSMGVATATRAYHWPDAPVGAADMARFFSGVMQRVDTRMEEEDRVVGFVMSYGWDDICRWVDKGLQGRRRGWAVFLRDLERASQLGVGVWRCKLLVVGA